LGIPLKVKLEQHNKDWDEIYSRNFDTRDKPFVLFFVGGKLKFEYLRLWN